MKTLLENGYRNFDWIISSPELGLYRNTNDFQQLKANYFPVVKSAGMPGYCF
jgi:hypothetical protein